jgi:hypothetical protein
MLYQDLHNVYRSYISSPAHSLNYHVMAKVDIGHIARLHTDVGHKKSNQYEGHFSQLRSRVVKIEKTVPRATVRQCEKVVVAVCNRLCRLRTFRSEWTICPHSFNKTFIRSDAARSIPSPGEHGPLFRARAGSISGGIQHVPSFTDFLSQPRLNTGHTGLLLSLPSRQSPPLCSWFYNQHRRTTPQTLACNHPSENHPSRS